MNDFTASDKYPASNIELSQDTRNILGLQLPTDPRWVDLAGKSMADILTDHAYCEQKAATSCISIIQRYPENEKLVKELSPIVTEEWGHFRLVLQDNKKDFSTHRGLMQLVGKRKRLLNYLQKHDLTGYRQLIEKLGIRK